jgi:hypothetical protein
MSASSVRWTCIEISGVSSSRSPLTGDANATPSSRTLRSGRGSTPGSRRVGEERPRPSHEAVEASVRRDHSSPGRKPQVERVAEHDLRADVLELRGDIALTLP